MVTVWREYLTLRISTATGYGGGRMSSRELQDLGIDRADIRRIARGSAL